MPEISVNQLNGIYAPITVVFMAANICSSIVLIFWRQEWGGVVMVQQNFLQLLLQVNLKMRMSNPAFGSL